MNFAVCRGRPYDQLFGVLAVGPFLILFEGSTQTAGALYYKLARSKPVILISMLYTASTTCGGVGERRGGSVASRSPQEDMYIWGCAEKDEVASRSPRHRKFYQ